jgi:hypothetical protein
MKTVKTILVALVLMSSVSLTSCQKCATCTMTTTTSVNVNTPGYPQVTKSTFEACGQDLSDVNGKTTTASSTVDGITATVVSKTVCN